MPGFLAEGEEAVLRLGLIGRLFLESAIHLGPGIRQVRVNNLEWEWVLDPHASTLLELARALGCPVDDLLAGHGTGTARARARMRASDERVYLRFPLFGRQASSLRDTE
jgi:hypothetical protein